MNSELWKYKYYDTPEGKDVFYKTFVTSKYAAATGFAAASLDVMMFSHPKGVVKTLGRYAWYMGPLIGMAAGFTATANIAQNYRGKNDKINYFLGGITAGSIFGAWARSITIGVPAAIVLGVAAVVKKTGVDEGWVFFPDVTMATKSIQSVRHDWTMTQDVEGYKNYTTGSK